MNERVTSAAGDIVCPICGCVGWKTALTDLRDRQFDAPGVFQLLLCEGCGVGRISPVPADLSVHYPPAYGPHVGLEGLGPLRPWHPAVCRMSFSRSAIIRWIGRNRIGGNESVRQMWEYLDKPPASVFDYGCGSGRFLARMRQVGIPAAGVDVSEHAIGVARSQGLNALVGSYESIPSEIGTYEVVRLWHVLEHLSEPVQALSNLSRHVAPGGKMVVAVPNIASALYQAFGADWFQLDAPRHLWHFDVPTLSKAFSAAGLKTERVVFSGDGPGILESIRYAMNSSGQDLGIDGERYARAGEAMAPLAEAWNDVGVGDSIVMVGSKRS